MLLDLWGLIQKNLFRGANSRKELPVIVEYEGKEFRVPESQLAVFLKRIEKRTEKIAKKVVRKQVVEKKQVRVVEAPKEIEYQVTNQIEATNDQLDVIWQMIQDKLQQLDDEEVLLLLGA